LYTLFLIVANVFYKGGAEMNKKEFKVDYIGEIDLSKVNDNFCQILLDSLLTLLKQQKTDA